MSKGFFLKIAIYSIKILHNTTLLHANFWIFCLKKNIKKLAHDIMFSNQLQSDALKLQNILMGRIHHHQQNRFLKNNNKNWKHGKVGSFGSIHPFLYVNLALEKLC